LLLHIITAPTAHSDPVAPKISNEAFVLTLPGKSLDVSLLVNKKKKFRSRGGREGALQTMQQLEEEGLGRLVPKKAKGSIKTWDFEKTLIPDSSEEKLLLSQKLGKQHFTC
jgi:hypothetical protein